MKITEGRRIKPSKLACKLSSIRPHNWGESQIFYIIPGI